MHDFLFLVRHALLHHTFSRKYTHNICKPLFLRSHLPSFFVTIQLNAEKEP